MERVFLTIFGMSITASLLVIAVLALRPLLKKAPKALFCILWGFVAIRLICPISMESPFSLVPAKLTATDSAVFEPVQIRTEPSEEELTTEIVAGFENLTDSYSDSTPNSVQIPEENRIIPVPIADTVITKEKVSFLKGISFAASVLWPFGIAGMLLYGGISYLRIRKKIKEAVFYRDNIWLCDRVASPFILGVIRPRIILPSSIQPEEAEHVIAHEQAHLKRLDHFWKPLGFLLLAVYWFNPVLWIAYLYLCKDIELACDERVIRNMNAEEIKSYSSTLLHYSISRKMISVCPLAFGEVHVKKRIKNVLHYKRPAFWVILLAVISCIAVAVCFLTNPVKPKEEETQTISEDKGELLFLSFALKDSGSDITGLEISTEPYTCFTKEQLSDISLPVNWINHNYNRDLSYGEGFDILHYENDTWTSCATEEFVSPSVTHVLARKTEQKETYSLDFFDLSRCGLYRFRAEPSDGNYVWLDFELTAAYENSAGTLPGSSLLAIADGLTKDKLSTSGIRTEHKELYDLLLAGGTDTVTAFVNALTIADKYGPREYFLALICSEITGIGIEQGDYDPEAWWGTGDDWLRIYNKHLASEEYRELAVSEGNLPSGTIAAWKNTALLADYYHPKTPTPRSIVWVNYFYNRTKNPDGSLVMELPEFPGITFYANSEKISADTPEGMLTLLSYPVIWSTYLTDLNNDSYPEICATVSSETAPEHLGVVIYDIKKHVSYTLWDSLRYDYTIIGNQDSVFVQRSDRLREEEPFVGKPALTEHPDQNTVTLELQEANKALYHNAWTPDHLIDLTGYSNLYADLQMDENRFTANSSYPICYIRTEEDWEAFTAAYSDVIVWKNGQLLSIKEALGADIAFHLEHYEGPDGVSFQGTYPGIELHTVIYLTPHGLSVGISSLPENTSGFAAS